MVTWQQLIQPQRSIRDPAAFFAGRETMPIQGSEQPNKNDAWWMAKFSHLAYVQKKDVVEKCLAGSGFTLVHAVLDANAPAGTQFIKLRGDVGGGKIHSVVAFRGTQPDEAIDILTDVNAGQEELPGGCRVHGGFWGAFNAIARDLGALDGTVWLTGHSLGGALAAIAADKFPGARIYTFGQPHVGNDAYVRSLLNPVAIRVENGRDLVARIVGLLPDYRKVGVPRHLGAGRTVTDQEPVAHPLIDGSAFAADALELLWLGLQAARKNGAFVQLRAIIDALRQGHGPRRPSLHELERWIEGISNLLRMLFPDGGFALGNPATLAIALLTWPPEPAEEVRSPELADHAIEEYEEKIAASNAAGWQSAHGFQARSALKP